jgi:hypothetical protein
VYHDLYLIQYFEDILFSDDIPARQQDDDALSTSVRSVASSCSIASEIYERAKKRRDLFWAPNGEVRL